MARISWRVTAGIDDRITHNGRPVRGSTTATLMDSTNALLAARGLRWMTGSLEMAQPSNDDSAAPSFNPRLRWVASPLAQYVYVGIWYYAEWAPSGTVEITAELYNVGGASIDGPVTWSKANGLLEMGPADPTTPESKGATYSEAGPPFTELPRDKFVDTGWSARATGGEPRLLDLGSAQGAQVEVRFTMQNARIYSMVVGEAFMTEAGT